MAENFITRAELEERIAESEAKMLAWFKEMLVGAFGQANIDDAAGDVPGIAPKKGKAFIGEKFDLRVRVDRALYMKLFEDAARNYTGNMSRCLDVALWRYYGRPKLSWEKEGKNE
jgi:hypothetical protein